MDKAFDGFIDWLKSVITDCLDKLVAIRLMELEGSLIGIKKVTKLLDMDSKTFRMKQAEYEELGFPKELPGKKWKKLAVLRWLADEN